MNVAFSAATVSAVAMLLVGCAWPGALASDGPAAVGQVDDSRLVELSGIVASRRNPGLYYVHNDSGDTARVFLITREGRTKLTVNLAGATSIDAEDIALAPAGASSAPTTTPATKAAKAPAGKSPSTRAAATEPNAPPSIGDATAWDVCLADIGDNSARRKTVTIFRFPEPALDPNGPAEISVTPTIYTLRYADGPINAEAFFVHPTTGDGYILTKRLDGVTDVYKLAAPWAKDTVTELPRVAHVVLPEGTPLSRVVTGADISPDGRIVVVRCYLNGFAWTRAADATGAFERVFDAAPARLSLAAEPQGEGICFSADGRKLLTVSEGESPTIYEGPAPGDSE